MFAVRLGIQFIPEANRTLFGIESRVGKRLIRWRQESRACVAELLIICSLRCWPLRKPRYPCLTTFVYD